MGVRILRREAPSVNGCLRLAVESYVEADPKPGARKGMFISLATRPSSVSGSSHKTPRLMVYLPSNPGLSERHSRAQPEFDAASTLILLRAAL